MKARFTWVFALLMALACPASFAAGQTWYVQAGAIGGDGSKGSPFGVIQDAVKEASGGDTICVAEGTYATGGGDESGIPSRVSIVDKPGLRLIGAGRGKSFIVGSRDPSSGDEFGVNDDAVRCVYVSGSSGAIIEGFTLRDGATRSDGSLGKKNTGAGFCADGDDTYLVDCEIVHCAGKYGPSCYMGTAIRCLVDGCYGTGGPGGYLTRYVNSVITRSKTSGGSTATLYSCSIYNCTVVDNTSTWAVQTVDDKVYNSVLALSGNSLMYRETNKVCTVENSILANDAPHEYRQFIAPAIGDWRLTTNGDAVNAGDAKWLSGLELPEGIDALVDFNGKAIVPDASNRINAGAIQEAVEPKGSAMLFTGGQIEVEDYVCRREQTYLYVTSYPEQVVLKVVAPDLFRINRIPPGETKFDAGKLLAAYPQLDGRIFVMPSPDPDVLLKNELVFAARVLWVDAGPKGSDSNDGQSEDTPFKTLKAASDFVAAESKTTVVYVKKGEYASEVMSYCGNVRLAVNNKTVRFVAVDGPAETAIVGEADQTTGGCGANAVKLLSLRGSGVAVQGFTLKNGFTDEKTASDASYRDAIWGSYSSMILDCIITNCVANRDVIHDMRLIRCRVIDCTCGEGGCVFSGCMLSSVYAAGNVNPTGGSGTTGWCGSSACYHTTFVSTPRSGRVGGDGTFVNAIIDGGANLYSSTHATNAIVWNVANVNYGASDHVEETDPDFADRGKTGDVLSVSPAIGFCSRPTADNYGDTYWKFVSSDVDGNALAMTADGKLTAGAIQTPVPGAVVDVGTLAGGLELASGVVGRNYLSGEKTVSFRSADTGTRPCAGITVDGENLLFTNGVASVISLGLADFLGKTVTAVPLYTTDWYVDAVKGNDANSGMFPTAARQTLVEGMKRCASGDTLWALPGEYKDGLDASNPNQSVSNRVYVKAGVCLKSTEGAEKTIIRGAAAKTDPDEHGCGLDGVRCVLLGWASSTSGTIDGFTLADGHCYGKSGAATDYDAMGGGVLSLSSMSGRNPANGVWVRNCVITNCAAYNAVASRVCLENCRVVGNAGGSALVYQGSGYGSYFNGNTATRVFNYSLNLVGCTIGPDNKDGEKNAQPFANTIGGTGAIMRNSLVCLPTALGGSQVTEIRNCVFAKKSDLSAHADIDETVVVAATDDDVAIDANGAPVIGKCLAVDAGNNDWIESETDLAGSQRIYNGTVDAGCFEADWRPVYAKCIGRSRYVSVTAADPSVTTNEIGQVTIPSGSLAAALANDGGADATYVLKVAATGGALTVSVDGVPVAEPIVSGTREIELKNLDALARLDFAFDPAAENPGTATILSLRKQVGMLLIVR